MAPPPHLESEDTEAFGIFSVGEETIAIAVKYLTEAAHIDKLQRGIDCAPNSLGVISVRGTLVPVIDPLNAYQSRPSPPRSAAVIGNTERVSGLAVDSTKGIRRYPNGALQRLTSDGGNSLSLATIYDDGEIIQVLNVDTILDRHDLPKTCGDLRKSSRSQRKATSPVLTFEAGGVSFAVRPDRIEGTVPRQKIEDDTQANEKYLGTITYFDRRVPVLATNRVLGLGSEFARESFETVVFRFPGGRFLGLAADRIVRVANCRGDEQRNLADHVKRSIHFVEASILLEEQEHFLVDGDLIVGDPHLNNLAKLSGSDERNEDTSNSLRQRGLGRGHESQRYFLVEVGGKIGVPIIDIDGIQQPPAIEKVTDVDQYGSGLMGLFFSDGELVPLVRLSEFLGYGAFPESNLTRVFTCSWKGQRVGWLVDKVTGVAVAEWTEGGTKIQDKENAVVSLRGNGVSEIRNTINLRAVTKRIIAEHEGS